MRVPSITRHQKRGSTLIWLAYVLFFFIQPILEPSRKLWLSTLGIFALYLIVVSVFLRTERLGVQRSMTGLTFLLGLMSFPWNVGGMTFFIYAATFLPFCVESVPVILSGFVVESLVVAAEAFWWHIHWIYPAQAILLLLVVGGCNIFFAQQRRSNDKLHAAQEENIALAAVVERERMRPMSNTKKQKAGSTFIWLAYVLFFFIQPILDPSRKLWLSTLGIFALYLIVVSVFLRTERTDVQRWMTGLTFLLGLTSFPWNVGGITFFIYAAGFLPFCVESVPVILSGFVAESLVVAAEAFWWHIHWMYPAQAIFLLLVVGGGNIFFAQQRRSNDKLHAAQEENITLAAVAERERIARDLHDVLGHTLSVIVLKAELAGRLVERDPQRAAIEIGDVEHTARTALAEVREAIVGYRARGLASEIETARRTLDAAGVTLLSDTEHAGATGLTSTEETVLSLALREAVTNIVRHARATTCRLHFISENGHRRLVVEDNGEHAIAREGNGLRGMRERIESIGGQLSLERESGTRLLIDLPLRTEGVVS